MQQVEPTILKETRKQDTHSLFITPCEASERMRTPKNTNKQESQAQNKGNHAKR